MTGTSAMKELSQNWGNYGKDKLRIQTFYRSAKFKALFDWPVLICKTLEKQIYHVEVRQVLW